MIKLKNTGKYVVYSALSAGYLLNTDQILIEFLIQLQKDDVENALRNSSMKLEDAISESTELIITNSNDY